MNNSSHLMPPVNDMDLKRCGFTFIPLGDANTYYNGYNNVAIYLKRVIGDRFEILKDEEVIYSGLILDGLFLRMLCQNLEIKTGR